MDENNPNPTPNETPNEEILNAANAMEASAETPAETPVETPTDTPAEEPKAEEKPINEENSAAMDALLNEEEAPKAEEAPAETPAPEAPVETPAEPVAEPTSEPAPALETPVEPAPGTIAAATPVVEASAEPATSAAPAPEAAPAAPKKKGKKGLIIGVAVGVVAALGIGGFALAYSMNNSEENIALSAISDLFTNHAKTVSGYFELTTVDEEDDDDKATNCLTIEDEDEDEYSSSRYQTNCISSYSYKNPISKVRVDIKNNTNSNNENSTSATFLVTYNDKDYKINLDSVVIKDYTMYVSLSNLKETIKSAIEEVTKDNTSMYADYAELYEDLINKVVGEVDGVWWKISVPDLVDSIDEMSSTDKSKIKEAYSCAVDVANKAANDGGKYAEIYKANAFVGIKKYAGGAKPSAKGDLYNLNLDANKFASFANAMADQIETYGIEDCLKKLDGVSGVSSTSYSRSEVKAENVEDSFKAINENFIIAIENGFFSHKLSGIYLDKTDESYRGVLDLKIEDLNGSISAPSDAKDISELVKNVTNAYTEWYETATCKQYKANYPSLYNAYCDPATDKLLQNRTTSTSRTNTLNV